MPRKAFALALVALLLWSLLAYLAARLSYLPALWLLGVAFTLSGLIGGLRPSAWKVSPKVLLIGVGGIFGYHYFYFLAFRLAPAVETNLINYLWPLLIVLLSPLFLPETRLRPHHLLGGLMGLSGALLILSGGKLHLEAAYLQGYLLAAGAALIWAGYTLLTKRLQPFPNAAVGAFCLLSGLLALSAYFIETGSFNFPTPKPADWPMIVLIGLGPMGLAFFAWDAAVKLGDPRLIGALSYLTPLTSTAILVLLGGRSLGWTSLLALLLIVGGAAAGSWDMLHSAFSRRPSESEVDRG
jgi:drug/metabolite transporter (DMT)-like permease